jgi:hypothetical protein
MKMNGGKKEVAALDNEAIVPDLKGGSGNGKYEVIHAQDSGDIKVKA